MESTIYRQFRGGLCGKFRSSFFPKVIEKRANWRETVRFGFALPGSHDHSLDMFKGASTDILRARQGLFREFGLAELLIRLVQLKMDVPK
jgi:hypothetical protein